MNGAVDQGERLSPQRRRRGAEHRDAPLHPFPFDQPHQLDHPLAIGAGENRDRLADAGGVEFLALDHQLAPFLREALVAAIRIPLDYRIGGRDQRVMELILDEIEAAPRLPLTVPMPRDPRLARLCERMIADPAEPVTLESLAAEIHVSGRTLARLFHRELGTSFGDWQRRMRLLLSLPRLAAGASVLEVALEHGYDSPSAFAAMFRRTLGMSPTAYLNRID